MVGRGWSGFKLRLSRGWSSANCCTYGAANGKPFVGRACKRPTPCVSLPVYLSASLHLNLFAWCTSLIAANPRASVATALPPLALQVGRSDARDLRTATVCRECQSCGSCSTGSQQAARGDDYLRHCELASSITVTGQPLAGVASPALLASLAARAVLSTAATSTGPSGC